MATDQALNLIFCFFYEFYILFQIRDSTTSTGADTPFLVF